MLVGQLDTAPDDCAAEPLGEHLALRAHPPLHRVAEHFNILKNRAYKQGSFKLTTVPDTKFFITDPYPQMKNLGFRIRILESKILNIRSGSRKTSNNGSRSGSMKPNVYGSDCIRIRNTENNAYIFLKNF